MRRPNKSGCIMKLPGKRRRPYAVRVFEGIKVKEDGKGTPIYKYLGYFEKYNDAMHFLEKYNASPVRLDVMKDIQVKHRFSEIYDLYIEELQSRSKQLSKQSYDSRNAAYNKLKPLHPMVFENVRLEDLERVVKEYSNMSYSTMTNIMIVLRGMYKTAMRHKYVSEDLSALMIVDSLNEKDRPHAPFTPHEIDILWAHTDDFFVRLYLILIYTGMRVNELLKMKSEDVHLEERYMVGGLKTDAGKSRIIPIAEKIVPFLDVSHEYLITLNGRKLTYSYASEHASEALESLGMKHTFHDTRHTCASLMEKAGIDVLHRKLILGHKSGDITDRYTHVSNEDLITDINVI